LTQIITFYNSLIDGNFILDNTLKDISIYQLKPNSTIFNNYWSRGHLCPSFVMSFDKSANGSWESTYKMSNIVPQNINFNIKNWKYLEYNTIKFASQNIFDTCIVTGCANFNQNVFSKYQNNFCYLPPSQNLYQVII